MTGWLPSFQRYQNYWHPMSRHEDISENVTRGGGATPRYAGIEIRHLTKRERVKNSPAPKYCKTPTNIRDRKYIL